MDSLTLEEVKNILGWNRYNQFDEQILTLIPICESKHNVFCKYRGEQKLVPDNYAYFPDLKENVAWMIRHDISTDPANSYEAITGESTYTKAKIYSSGYPNEIHKRLMPYRRL